MSRISFDSWYKGAQEPQWGRSPLHGSGLGTFSSQVNAFYLFVLSNKVFGCCHCKHSECACCSLTFRQEASRTAASVAEIHRHAGGGERSTALVGHLVSASLTSAFNSSKPNVNLIRMCVCQSLMEGGGTRNSSLMRKAPTMPKPQWHAPWKLSRVSPGWFRTSRPLLWFLFSTTHYGSICFYRACL